MKGATVATDNTDSFASDVEGRSPSREELERQLKELDNPSSELDVTEAVDAETDWDDDEEEDLDAIEWQDVESEFLGRAVRLSAPTDVAVTMFQQDMSSRVASGDDKIVIMGDFARQYMHPEDFYEWRTKIQTEAARNPRHAFGVFKRENEKMLETLIGIASDTDSDYIKEELNRSEKRAALKRKKARLKAGQDRR